MAARVDGANLGFRGLPTFISMRGGRARLGDPHTWLIYGLFALGKGVFTLVTRGRFFLDVGIKILHSTQWAFFDVSQKNDCTLPNVKTP